jgi:hypothetical protein
VTDTPVRFISPRAIGVLQGAFRPHPGAATLYEQIKIIRAQQQPVTVVTSWAGVLTNRWPEVITGAHGAADGGSIRISINFVRFRFVRTQLVPSEIDSDVQLLSSQTVTQQQFVS